jgi:hypothetical protein
MRGWSGTLADHAAFPGLLHKVEDRWLSSKRSRLVGRPPHERLETVAAMAETHAGTREIASLCIAGRGFGTYCWLACLAGFPVVGDPELRGHFAALLAVVMGVDELSMGCLTCLQSSR